MCSSPKSSSSSKIKKVRTSPLSNSELNNFVAIANASDARREERERLELERLASESAHTAAMGASTAGSNGPGSNATQLQSRPYVRFLRSVHTTLTASRSWGVAG